MRKKVINKKINDKKTMRINIGVSILLIVTLSFISVGYALYGQILNSRGTITLHPQGKIAITDVTLTSSKNVKSGSIPAHTDDSVDFNLTFEKEEGTTEEGYQAVYSITIDNQTFYDYDFNLANFQPIIKNSSGIEVDPSYLNYTLEGINLGDSIPAGESVTFTLTLDFTPEEDDTYSVDGNMGTDLVEQPHGSVLGSIPNDLNIDLRESENNNLAAVVVTVINSYQSSRTFTLGITDTSHFELTDVNGNALNSFTIEGGQTVDYTIYVKRVDTARYSQEYFNTNIVLSYADVTNSNCGSVTIRVDEEEVPDTTPPEISNLSVTINDATSDDTSANDVGSVTLNWTGTEAESAIEKYYVLVYEGTSTEGQEYETPDNNPQITITGLKDTNYYFKVYGKNTKTITLATDQIASCSNQYCAKTASSNYKWHYTISLSDESTNINSISPTAVNRGKNTVVTITPNSYEESGGTCGGTTTNYYTISNNITVTMDSNTMTTGTSAGQYTFSRTTSGTKTGKLNLYGVTGNIEITATASQ